jgi:uncharacterized protein (DUF1501 family)
MLSRRQFLTRSLATSSLLSIGSVVPQFIARTAGAAEAQKDSTILVVIEMNGGNDGLNTVIPYSDDLYHKVRPTLKASAENLVKLNDKVGLHPGMRNGFEPMFKNGHLAVIQGVGYPNPDRSHFESMDVWQMGDPRRKIGSGWIGRSANDLQNKNGDIPMMHIGPNRLPVALQGGTGAISINNQHPYRLELGGGTEERHQARRKLLEDLAKPEEDQKGNLVDFVYRRQVQTLSTLDRLQELLDKSRDPNGGFNFGPDGRPYSANSLPVKLQLVARLIQQNFGTRVFYVMKDGFDTHSGQADEHRRLLAEVADGIGQFFKTLEQSKQDKRVLVMTFSEFGRRVQENDSKGTDHGAGSCMFVAGPALTGGVVGEHPSLKDLDAGDLKYHTDFRQVYATLLDNWLDVDSNAVLNGKFEHLNFLKAKKT